MTGEMLMQLMQGLLPGMTAEVPVQPIDDAAPEPAPEPAVVAGAGEAAVPLNVPMCVFCREDLGRLSVEALMCGHAFHTTCIHDYMAATGKSRINCCPFKCHCQALPVADIPEPATGPESLAGVQDEPVDDATANLALAVAAEAEANIF
jgi:hypothetical protein